MAAGEDLYRLDEGAFAALQPDLVITQDLCAVCAVDTADVTEALSYLGCSADVVSLDPMTLDDVLSTVRIVGEATGTVDQASKLTDDLRRRLAAVDERLAGVAIEQRPTTLVLEWTDPAFTGGHWVPEMVERAGGAPVLGFAGTHSRAVPWSDIAGSGAEVTIVAPCGYRLDGASSLAEETVRSGQLPEATSVWAMDADAHVVRPGPRVVDGIEILAAILHPELCGAPLGVHARRISPAG